MLFINLGLFDVVYVIKFILVILESYILSLWFLYMDLLIVF